MKLLLIKLGKVQKTLRQQGLFRGLKRIANYLFIYLKNNFLFSPKGDILIVGAGIGDVGHYRIFTQAEEFNQHGIKTYTTLQGNPFLLRLAKRYKIFILVRPVDTPKLAAFFKKIKDLGKLVIFDTDDLVFDSRFMHQTESYRQMNALEKKQYEKGVGEEIIQDPYVKFCSTTTTYLKRVLEGYGKKVFINTNKVSLHELDIAEKINNKKRHSEQREGSRNKSTGSFAKTQDDIIRLGYFSGTMSHNKDFATITEPLMRIMEKYPQVQLVLVGPLETENLLNKFLDRIIRSGLVSRDKLYEIISAVDINLAPVVRDDPFSESKSEIKFTGAGILKVPTVAVANVTFSGCITDGVSGFLAGNAEEWFQKLEKLILDNDFRKSMGEAAYQKTLKDYTIKNSHNEDYYNFLKANL